jgi:hypothetical protein
VSAEQQNMALVVKTAEAKHKLIINANQASLFIVFLCYPAMSATIFSMFACRELDAGEAWHVYDHSIDCRSAYYKAVRYLAYLLVIIIPIGAHHTGN